MGACWGAGASLSWRRVPILTWKEARLMVLWPNFHPKQESSSWETSIEEAVEEAIAAAVVEAPAMSIWKPS